MPAVMLLAFSLTLFLSATLLFLVQPMVGKLILPFLGGTPAVWNTCMVFFQALLLAGYSYAHFLSRRLSFKKQWMVHALVLALPILPLIFLRFDVVRVADYWPPPADFNPAWWLLAVLLLVAGIPFFVVSTSAPLLQKWFAATDHPSAGDPYFLYGASNLGSMLALLAYPAFVERYVGVQAQALIWTAGFFGLALLILSCGLATRKSAAMTIAEASVPDVRSVGPLRRLRWVLLAFVPSSLMLGLTTHITTDIAAIPLLWILPLALYLLSFIFVFSGIACKNLLHWLTVLALSAYFGHEFWIRLDDELSTGSRLALKVGIGLCAATPLFALLILRNKSHALLHAVWVLLLPLFILLVAFDGDLRRLGWLKEYQVILLHLAAVFVAAMVCHGELARTRPGASYLTGFFLLMSLGGVLGGLFNALLAPIAFDRIAEYPLVIAGACLLMPRGGVAHPGWLRRFDLALAGTLGLCGLLFAAYFLGNSYLTHTQVADFVDEYLPKTVDLPAWAKKAVDVVLAHSFNDDARLMRRERNFFGCFRIFRYESITGAEEFHMMLHGTTTHGMQCYYPEERRGEPLTYFHRQGPIGQLFEAIYAREKPQRVCILGVGTGTLAAYMKPGWDLTLYDIDPAVVRVAMDTRYFTYLPDARDRGVNVSVELGDGRLQIAKAPDHAFDLIVMDAFTSDAVPVHLLTREAFQTYLQKLAPGGLIVVNIANRYLEFESVLGNLAEDLQLEGRYCWGNADTRLDMYATNWVVLAREQSALGKLLDFQGDGTNLHWKRRLPTDPAIGVWTDDYSNLLAVFQWNR